MVDKVLLCRRYFGASIWTGSDPAVATCELTLRHASGRLSEVTSLEDDHAGSGSQVSFHTYCLGRYRFKFRRQVRVAKAVEQTTYQLPAHDRKCHSKYSQSSTPAELSEVCLISELPSSIPELASSDPLVSLPELLSDRSERLPSKSLSFCGDLIKGIYELPGSTPPSLSMTPTGSSHEIFESKSPILTTRESHISPLASVTASTTQYLLDFGRWFSYPATHFEHSDQAPSQQLPQPLTLQIEHQAFGTPGMVNEDASISASPISPLTPRSAALQHSPDVSPIDDPGSHSPEFSGTLTGLEDVNLHQSGPDDFPEFPTQWKATRHSVTHFPDSTVPFMINYNVPLLQPRTQPEQLHSMCVELPGSQPDHYNPGPSSQGSASGVPFGGSVSGVDDYDLFAHSAWEDCPPRPLVADQSTTANRVYARDLNRYTVDSPPMDVHHGRFRPEAWHQPISRVSGPIDPSNQASQDTEYSTETCLTCGTQFTGKYAKGNFGRHCREKHREVQTFHGKVCRVCKKTYNRADAKRKHEWKKHKLLDSRPHKRRKE